MADVFLSYERSNARQAAAIAEALKGAGRSVWFDADLPAHRAYSEVIEEQLEAAPAVLVLWSNGSVASQWVRSEANRARESGRLVQARLDDTRLPMPFDQIQCADLSSWRRGRANAGWTQATQSICALIDGDGSIHGAPAGRGEGGDARMGRRGVLAGGAAAAGMAALGGGWWLTHRQASGPPIPPATAALLEQAKATLWQNTREGQNQAIAMYRQVVTDVPTFADGWGHLALAYAWTAHYRESAEAETLRSRAQSAIRQAYAIDPASALATTALASAKPVIGNWMAADQGFRKAVSLAPKDSEVSFNLALFLANTGRNIEALSHMNLVLPNGPTPAIYYYQSSLLWAAGRQEELDHLWAEAARLYPTHYGIWFARFFTHMFSGRPGEALAMAADTTNRPSNIEPEEVSLVVRVAEAIQSRSPQAAEEVTAQWLRRSREGAGYAENAIQFMATLGRTDEAFAVLRAYFFSEGFDCPEIRFSASQGTYTPHNDRLTRFLFIPSVASLWPDPRFATLMNDLQLTQYWQASRSPPDYLARRT